ncbi:MAG TPA: calcium-binding protein [Solirubrobacteraceae bacterium]|nr:calcium-binding protein [Solirubrobacteraceae bacterium]
MPSPRSALLLLMLAALGAMLAVAPGAQAAACTASWGGGTGSWHSANWTGGTEPEADDVVCITGGQVTLAGPQAEVLEVQLSGAGTTLIVDATYLFADDPATIANPEEAKDGPVTVGAGATLRKTGEDSQIAGGTLLNQGTTHIAGGAGRTFRFSTSYANSGTLDVDVDQALALFGPTFTNTGTIDIAAGARLSADGVTFHQDAGQITGDGELEFSGGSLEHEGGNVAPSVTVGMAAGSIDPSGTGTATYSVGNGADSVGFTAGTKLTGDVAAGITLSILAGAFDRPTDEAKLALDADRTNHGTIELEQVAGPFGLTSILDVGGFTLTNTGTVSIPAASSGTRLITGTAFVNAAPGTVDVAHDTEFDVDVTNQGSFAIADSQTASSDRDVTQTGGTMTVDGRLEFTTDAALVLDGGALRGTGRVIGDLTNTGGVVDPGGPGEVVTMIVEGDYLQAAGGTLAADVAEGVADQLVAFGDASIAGALAVASAGYTPADDDRFRVLEVDGTLSGTFATATGLAAGGGRTYWIEYEGTPGRVHLKVVPQFTVTVSKAGTGAGTVTSAPAGIACGATCAARFDETATVTLTATAAAGSAFTGWSGSGCSDTGQCVVTTSEARAVTASFAAIPSGPPPPPAADRDGDDVPDAADPAPDDPSIPTAFGATNGDDVVVGTAAGETICGLLGDDEIDARDGDDTVYGDGCGVRRGPGGRDILKGGAGDDALFGAGGRDRLAGGAGKDRLVGGPGVNRYSGGGGDDRIAARNGKRETVNCGGGRKDVAVVDKRDKVKGCEKVKRARR